MDDVALRISMRRDATREDFGPVLNAVDSLADSGGVVVFETPEKLIAFIDLTVRPRPGAERMSS
jgi:hypothetical protein